MSYDEWSDNFQRSFPGGRFNSYINLGGQIVQFTNLVLSEDSKPISKATVIYNQEGKTWVIEELSGHTSIITPLSSAEYLKWKEARRETK